MKNFTRVIKKNSMEELRVELTEFNGHRLVAFRVFSDWKGDGMRATRKGITVSIDLLQEVIEALQEAQGALSDDG
jgi:hypothetical protein